MVRPMRTITRLTGAATLALVLAACGGGGGDDDGVASLDGGATTTTEGRGGGGGSVDDADFRDALLEYAECMRDQGVDMPDPEIGEDGSVAIVGGGGDGPPSAAEQEEFEAADAECRDIMEGVEGSLPEPTPEEQAEIRDQALAFAECMREQGIDFPDPQFGEGGRVTMGFGADAGIDPSDPEFQEAQEACSEGSGGFGVGFAPRAAEGQGEVEE